MAHELCTVIMQILRAQQSPFTSIAWKRAALTFYLISITVLNVRKCLEGHTSDQNLNTWTCITCFIHVSIHVSKTLLHICVFSDRTYISNTDESLIAATT